MTAPLSLLDAPTLTVVDATPNLVSGSQTWLSCYVDNQLVAWVHRRKPARTTACEPWRVRFTEHAHPTAAFYPRPHAEAIGLNARLGTCQVHVGGRAEALAYVRRCLAERAAA
jgi:hypothetical protein